MKEGIHPEYHNITVKMTNGETFETRSTYGKEGDTLQLDVDPNTHPAWTGGGAFVNKKAGKVADFNKKFGDLSLGGAKAATSKKKQESKKEENAEASEESTTKELKEEVAQPIEEKQAKESDSTKTTPDNGEKPKG